MKKNLYLSYITFRKLIFGLIRKHKLVVLADNQQVFVEYLFFVYLYYIFPKNSETAKSKFIFFSASIRSTLYHN